MEKHELEKLAADIKEEIITKGFIYFHDSEGGTDIESNMYIMKAIVLPESEIRYASDMTGAIIDDVYLQFFAAKSGNFIEGTSYITIDSEFRYATEEEIESFEAKIILREMS